MKLFLRIFLSYWLATILMIGLVLTVNEFLPLTFFGDSETKITPESAASALTTVADAYERQGQGILSSILQDLPATRHRPFYLLDAQGNVLAEDGASSPLYRELATEVLQSGHAERKRFGPRKLFACPIQSATGRRYAAVLTVAEPVNRLFRLRFWFNLTIAMVPAALVCFVLSLYLTRPITRLQAAVLRLAGGDLSARATPLKSVRKDELGDLARDFDAMAAQIQLLMTAQRRFVADVSHELGAPLTRMHLALALLRRRFACEKVGELQRIERETEKLSTLVQQLLLLARLEAGSYPAETLAPVSLRSLCDSVVEDANFEAAHAHCVVTGSRQDATLLVYPQLLRRAIDNILRNAILYAPAGTEILLNCEVDHDLHQVIVEILDCGPGVPGSMLSDIFRPFFRTAPGREIGSGGTGLGLSIATEAVRLHDGTVTAQNRKGGGLHVAIVLPLRTPVSEHESQPSVQTSGV